MRTLLILVLVFALVSQTGFAFRNECSNCRFVAEADDLICKNCGKYLNQCMTCNQANPVKNDSCEICCNPMEESRFLSTVAPDVREDLKLGQSPRAVLERENSQIKCFLERTPEQEATLLFNLAMNLKRMKFFSREADAWGNFLNKFPNHSEARAAKIYRSEAFVNWGYLFFREGNLQEAGNKFWAAISDYPSNVEALVWYGRTNLAMGNISEGRHAIRAALDIDPAEPRARYLMRADPRTLRSVPYEEAVSTRTDNMGDRYESAIWFPGVTVGQLK